jgi:3-dehydroquinate dehydratase-2
VSATILVLNGPNLNRLGSREPQIYGSETLDELSARLATRAKALDIDIEFFQSNHEGDLIDRLHAYRNARAAILNPGGLAHYSVSLRDAIAAIPIPVIEVHISNIYAREPFRQHSVLSGACRGIISGLGTHGYFLALEHLSVMLSGR